MPRTWPSSCRFKCHRPRSSVSGLWVQSFRLTTTCSFKVAYREHTAWGAVAEGLYRGLGVWGFKGVLSPGSLSTRSVLPAEQRVQLEAYAPTHPEEYTGWFQRTPAVCQRRPKQQETMRTPKGAPNMPKRRQCAKNPEAQTRRQFGISEPTRPKVTTVSHLPTHLARTDIQKQ